MQSTHRCGARHPKRSLTYISVALAILALLLTACGPDAPAGRQTQKASPTATLAQHPTVLPASTAGWATYSDNRFHFQVPVPPSWKAQAYTAYECPQGGDGAYIVGFFPPDIYPDAPGAIPSAYPFGKIHEFIDIYLSLCPALEGTPNPNRPAPEPGGILTGGIRAPYYVYDGYEWISRVANPDFGGQAYLFNYNAMPQDKGLRDLLLFHGMLAGFKYPG
jgi:hypothetical protein